MDGLNAAFDAAVSDPGVESLTNLKIQSTAYEADLRVVKSVNDSEKAVMDMLFKSMGVGQNFDAVA